MSGYRDKLRPMPRRLQRAIDDGAWYPTRWSRFKFWVKIFWKKMENPIRGVLSYLFDKRRLPLPDTQIFFHSGQGITPNQRLFDPIHRIYQVPVEKLGSRDVDGVAQDLWVCEQYREIPSRAQAVGVWLKHIFSFPRWIGIFIKSYLK